MMFGVFGLKLRAVVIVETRVVVENGCTWFWKRRENACCEPRDGGGDLGEVCGWSFRKALLQSFSEGNTGLVA